MKAIVSSLAILIMGSQALANYDLAYNGKAVVCYADDNQSWVLNARRTVIKYMVEGESLGPTKIEEVKSDNKSFASYLTSEGTLTISNEGNFYQFSDDEEAQQIDCK